MLLKRAVTVSKDMCLFSADYLKLFDREKHVECRENLQKIDLNGKYIQINFKHSIVLYIYTKSDIVIVLYTY